MADKTSDTSVITDNVKIVKTIPDTDELKGLSPLSVVIYAW